ncbi:sensor histidine kinase [Streptomyces sp. NPDC052043]|uniref:sensor histidine kinase n=1 Tax=Streptomyces sp. NPDC052043 TaxID=3365684 RepID=UPI0037CEB056
MARGPHPHRHDAYIAVGGLLGGLVLIGAGLYTRTRHDPVSVLDQDWAVALPLLVMAGCELLRRTRPGPALLVGTAAVVADLPTRGSLATLVMFTDLVYAAVLYGRPAFARRIPWITGLLTVVAAVVPLVAWRTPQALLLGVGVALVSLVPAATGWVVRNHRDTAVAERLRAEQTALLADMDRAQAVLAERSRVARELHDMIANHMSAVAIHSTAALSLDDPETSRQALAVIRENSVEGLAQMRRLIGVLRDSGDERPPTAAPTLDGLEALAEAARGNGLEVTLDARHGKVPTPVELAAYRIVQESLTNALKHAAPGPVTVTLARGAPPGPPRHSDGDGALEVRVTSPYGHRGGPRAPGSGAGLIGMRERAALLGGTFAAGPEDAVWTVRATLPLGDGEGEPA